jgi:hypothetical protein
MRLDLKYSPAIVGNSLPPGVGFQPLVGWLVGSWLVGWLVSGWLVGWLVVYMVG